MKPSWGKDVLALFICCLLVAHSSPAAISEASSYLRDYQGNGITSNGSTGSRNAVDVEVLLSGSIIDPRSIRALSSGTDSVSCVQGTSPWVGNISQFGGSNVVTGTGTSGSGIPRVTVSNDSTVGLVAGSAIIGKVGIDQTTPGTTNGVQVNAALPAGSNSIGQVTANAGTNLNTSALALSATQTNGNQKTQVVDGSGNVLPAGDVASRKIFVQPTDGTNNQSYTASNEAKVSVTQPLPAGTNLMGAVTTGLVQTTQPTAGTTGDAVRPSTDEYMRIGVIGPEASNTAWGKSFFASTNTAVLTTTIETPFFYFKNPNASGKTAKIQQMSVTPTTGNNYVTYRVYVDPTILTNGVAVTVVGGRQTGQATTVITPFTIPTVTANGNLIDTVIASGLSGNSLIIPYNYTLWVEANHSLLVTRQLSANATIGGLSIRWAEQ